MPKFLEKKLKAEYGEDSAIPYKIMNAQGLMRGNKETAKGERLEAKHKADVKAGTASTAKPKRKPKPRAHGLNWREQWGKNKVKKGK